MWKHIAANTLTVLIALMVGVAIAVSWAQNSYRTDGPLEAAMCLRVPAGSTFVSVSKDLERLGAISNGAIFRVGADYQGRSHLLKAGSFLIEPQSSMNEIVEQITTAGRSTCGSVVNYRIGVARSEIELREMNVETGRLQTVVSFSPDEAAPLVYEEAVQEGDLAYRVVLAEGVTSWQVVESLTSASFLSGEATGVPPEGMLAPGSYEFANGAERDEVLAEMVARQRIILDRAWAEKVDGLPLRSKEEALILASIIEKETAVADERRTISQVFINRLNRSMRLQTDPTVIYGITEGQGSLGRGLRRSELDRLTPWNTYQIDGLPPTPIANPGEAAIKAAVNPDGSEFIFFVADGSGGHAFASTLSEHNRNVAKWRAIEAERANGN